MSGFRDLSAEKSMFSISSGRASEESSFGFEEGMAISMRLLYSLSPTAYSEEISISFYTENATRATHIASIIISMTLRAFELFFLFLFDSSFFMPTL